MIIFDKKEINNGYVCASLTNLRWKYQQQNPVILYTRAGNDWIAGTADISLFCLTMCLTRGVWQCGGRCLNWTQEVWNLQDTKIITKYLPFFIAFYLNCRENIFIELCPKHNNNWSWCYTHGTKRWDHWQFMMQVIFQQGGISALQSTQAYIGQHK